MEKAGNQVVGKIDELTEILARGCLRLILKQNGKLSHKGLKQLDNSSVPSDQLDRKLTAAEKRRKV